jgi:hypothetical protein
MAIDHDQNFKTLIKAFFREFMELFLPREAALIDFSRIEFLEQEVFTDAPKGKRKRLDLVVKAGLKAGGDEFVLVHHEFQSEKEPGFPRRMCLCFFELFKRYDKVVVPVAIFTDDAVWRDAVPDFFSIRLNQEYLRFQYHLIKLKHLDYRKYLKLENPLAYGLMAKMNFDRREVLRLKADFFRLITGSKMDAARKRLLLQFVDTYMPLDMKEQERFDKILSDNPGLREVRKMTTTWELRGLRRGLRKGRREGRTEGETEGKRTTLLLQMQKKFGKLAPEVRRRIQAIDSAERLESLALAILDAKSVDQLDL